MGVLKEVPLWAVIISEGLIMKQYETRYLGRRSPREVCFPASLPLSTLLKMTFHFLGKNIDCYVHSAINVYGV